MPPRKRQIRRRISPPPEVDKSERIEEREMEREEREDSVEDWNKKTTSQGQLLTLISSKY